MKILTILVALIATVVTLHAFPVTQSSGRLDKNGTEVSFTPLVNNLPYSGYYPVEVTFSNRSSKEQTLHIDSMSTSSAGYSYSYLAYQNRSLDINKSFKFSVGGNETKKYQILVPVARHQRSGGNYSAYMTNVDFVARVGGRELYFDFEGAGGADDANILFSPGVKGQKVTSFQESRTFHLESFPNQLKAIRGYSVIMFTIRDLERLSKAQLSNLVAWVGQGGVLIFHANTKGALKELTFIEKNFRNADVPKKINTSSSESIEYKAGAIEFVDSKKLSTLLKSNQTWSDSSGVRATKSYFTQNDFSVTSHIRNDFSYSTWPLNKELPTKVFGVALLCLFVIIFVILVAPLNFFVFARQGQRHRLFITTPLIAVAGSLLLLLFILLSEGVGAKGVRLIHMELDPERSQAFINQQQLVRSGVLFSTTFNLDEELDIYQVPISESRWARVIRGGEGVDEKYSYSDSENGSIRHSGNYFSSRSEHGHLIRGHISTKANIDVSRKGEGVTVASTFKETVETVYVKSDGEYYKVSNLSTGKNQMAEKVSKADYLSKLREVENSFNGDYKVQFSRRMRQPNCFFAITNDAGGIDTLKGIRWKSSKTIITGDLTSTSL